MMLESLCIMPLKIRKLDDTLFEKSVENLIISLDFNPKKECVEIVKSVLNHLKFSVITYT